MSLLLLSYLLIGEESIIGDRFSLTDIATLCGAMVGAGAVFIGNQINNWYSSYEEGLRTRRLQDSLKILLMAELVTIVVQHIRQAKYYQLCKEDMEREGTCSGYWFDETYQIPQPVVFESLIAQLPVLPTKAVDSIVTFYNNISATRQFVNDARERKSTKSLALNHAMTEKLKMDCEDAIEVVRQLAPNRKFKLTDGSEVLLTDLLSNPTKLR